jgi:hypothetical protein
VRVVDIEAGVAGNHLPICVGGRGAAPPEFCGGTTGYRLMLKRQRLGGFSECANRQNHLQDVGERLAEELGEERELNQFDGTEEAWAQQPLPDGPITVGLDVGFDRAQAGMV